MSNFTESVFVTPVESAIFHVAFVAGEDVPGETNPLKIKAKRAFDVELPSGGEVLRCGTWRQAPVLPLVRILQSKDLPADIYIPPERLS